MERFKLYVNLALLGVVLGVGAFAVKAYLDMKPSIERVTLSQENFYKAQTAEIEQAAERAAERPEITQEMYNRQVQQARKAAERVAELEAKLEPKPEPVPVVEPEPEPEPPRAAFYAPCGGVDLHPLEGWNDQPKKDRPGRIHTNLRYRWVSARHPCTLAPGTFQHETLGKVVVGPNPQARRGPRTYKTSFGTLTVHGTK